MTDFLSSEAGQCASIAKQFLDGALTLSEAQRDRGKILFRPTLALAGHGLELMLKACLYLNSQTPKTQGKEGHDIVKPWKTETCEPVRSHVYANARLVAAHARTVGKYTEVPSDDQVLPLIEEYVVALGKLHGGDGYPLRYTSKADQKAPSTPLLVQALWRTADDLVKRPDEFKLSPFHGSR